MIHIATVHLIILALITLATTMIMIVTASNALRLRNVELSWRSGKLSGYPLFSTIFLFMTITLTVLVHTQQLYHHTVTMVCYNWIGLTWFVTSYLMSKRFITDHGIVKNINDPSQTVSWSRILDYVEKNDGKQQKFIFFYPEHLPGERSRSIRLELVVPAAKKSSFGRLLQKKLGRRFSLGELESTGIEQHK